ncbi:MAG: S1/P1 nuclease [Gammaproteobacteria bacterium]
MRPRADARRSTVWDLHLMERFIEENRREDGTEYKHKAHADAIDRGVPPDRARQWQSSATLDWARESREARGAAYDVGDGRLGKDYYEKAISVANRRIVQAGCRLAGC